MTSTHTPMKTEISRFCQDYSKILLPLRGNLGKGVDFIRDQQETDDIKESLSKLCDAHHRLKTLAEKIDSQQAYVIIFGPLKSGKSTLMNAFSGAYVSEVTALPAYPCLVHVRHEEKTSMTASRFNGQTERFDDYRQMQEAIEVYHRELADEIRAVEERGESFEPGIHCPSAIRRLDIGLPAEPLKESYTILVDTPGLYSRMKFGYDLMSREFRDSAACAVFVVKTDNLFLEQVFDEFNDLLNLFSRIFLVVNIDGHKCDLEPDGELRPSLESSDPQRIIDAFCSLSMSAPLRNAHDNGRLKIYPIDLLRAAAERLGEKSSSSEQEYDTAAQTSENDAVEVNDEIMEEDSESQVSGEEPLTGLEEEVNNIGSGKFEEFMGDLTEYLNSNDYLVHFMQDSLRQGRHLIQEIEEASREDNLKTFIAGQKSLQADYERESERRKALGRLRKLDWKQAFSGIRKGLKEATENFVQSEQERLSEELIQEVEEWFESSDSLDNLLEQRVGPKFEMIPELFREFMLKQMEEATNTSLGGADLSDENKRDLDKVEVSLPEVRRKALDAALEFGQTASLPETGTSAATMPVRRRFWDWILFRSMNRIRERIFGPESKPGKTISIKLKQTRLGDKSKTTFCDTVQQQLQDVFANLSTALSSGMKDAYIESATESVGKILDRKIEDLDMLLPRLQNRIQIRAKIRKTLDNLSRQTSSHEQDLATLEDTFSHLHPEVRETLEDSDDESSEESEEGMEEGMEDVSSTDYAFNEPAAEVMAEEEES